MVSFLPLQCSQSISDSLKRKSEHISLIKTFQWLPVSFSTKGRCIQDNLWPTPIRLVFIQPIPFTQLWCRPPWCSVTFLFYGLGKGWYSDGLHISEISAWLTLICHLRESHLFCKTFSGHTKNSNYTLLPHLIIFLFSAHHDLKYGVFNLINLCLSQ